MAHVTIEETFEAAFKEALTTGSKVRVPWTRGLEKRVIESGFGYTSGSAGEVEFWRDTCTGDVIEIVLTGCPAGSPSYSLF